MCIFASSSLCCVSMKTHHATYLMLQQWEHAMEQAKHLSSMHNTVHKFWSNNCYGKMFVLCSGVLRVCGGKCHIGQYIEQH
jgi:hypothetical protein